MRAFASENKCNRRITARVIYVKEEHQQQQEAKTELPKVVHLEGQRGSKMVKEGQRWSKRVKEGQRGTGEEHKPCSFHFEVKLAREGVRRKT